MRNLGGGSRGPNSPPIFFKPSNSFLTTEFKGGNKRKKYFLNQNLCGIKTEKKRNLCSKNVPYFSNLTPL